MQFVGKQDTTWIGRPPEDWLPRIEPGKNAQTVGQQQSLGGQISADCQQPVFLGLFNRREPKILIELVTGHGPLWGKFEDQFAPLASDPHFATMPQAAEKNLFRQRIVEFILQ